MMRELMLETRADAIAYGMDLMADLAKVRLGQKPLVIAEESKCPTAFQALGELVAEDVALDIVRTSLVGEDGEMTSVAFVCGKGAPYAREARDAIFEHIGDVAYRKVDGQKSRRALQMKLGMLLGYSASEVVDFILSPIAQTCVCDCCGGPETAIEVHEGGEHITLASDDPNPGRFVENSYRY
jgi:hypothetical protein